MPNESAKHVAIEAKHLRPHFDHVSLRPDALAAFADAFESHLCVVCAPAGYGKTTVTAAALAHCGKTAEWYKLDVLDRDPLIFLASLVRAAQRQYPDFGSMLLMELEAGPIAEVPLEILTARFCSECDRLLAGDLYLVLDDYHEAMDSVAMDGVLSYLLENCPATVHYVVLTRYEPTFRLEKLRLAGEVFRVPGDLFLLNEKQVAEVLGHRSGREHGPADVQRLLELTEGWPASVVLAGMALAWLDVASLEAALSDPRLRGDVFSYLAEQVFQRQSDEVRRFLLGTCCLEHVTVQLAEALTSSSRAARHLNFLSRNHVFTFDTELRGAYRYHNLLRDFLRQRFVQDEGETAFRALQRKTAAVLEDCGDRQAAVELLLSANELELALGVVARGGETELERRPSEQLRLWVERLSPSAESGDPWALIVGAVLDTRDSRFARALEQLRHATATLEGADNDRALYQALSITEWAEFWSGDCEASMRTCSRALELADTEAERLHTLLSLSSAALDMRLWDEVAAASAKADGLLPRANAEEITRAQALRAHAAFYQGDIAAAQALIRHCSEGIQSSAQRATALNTEGMIALALSEYLEASSCFERATEIAKDYGQLVTSSMIEDNVALLEASVGDFDSAGRRLAGLSSHTDELGPTVLCFVLTHQGTVLRRKGAIQDSLDPTGSAAELIPEERDPYLVLNARANLAFAEGLLGLDRDAHLKRLSVTASKAGVQFVELKAVLYSAILASFAGLDVDAAGMLEECLPRQLELGHINLIAQELCPRPQVASLVLKTVGRGPFGLQLLTALSRHWSFEIVAPQLCDEAPKQVCSWVKHLLAATADPTGQRAASPGRAPVASPTPRPRQSALNDLTPREIEVLRLMAANRSNAEIAGELFVALSTVKTHVNHILSKMGQTNRIGAVLLYQQHRDSSGEAQSTVKSGASYPPHRPNEIHPRYDSSNTRHD